MLIFILYSCTCIVFLYYLKWCCWWTLFLILHKKYFAVIFYLILTLTCFSRHSSCNQHEIKYNFRKKNLFRLAVISNLRAFTVSRKKKYWTLHNIFLINAFRWLAKLIFIREILQNLFSLTFRCKSKKITHMIIERICCR